MPLVHSSRRHFATERARRHARVQAGLARIPAAHLSGTHAEAVMARAEAFGIEPGQVYGRRGAAPSPLASQPFVGEIIMFGGNFEPAGWLTCAGQLLPISEYDALFALIGTTYGGNGTTTFGLPDLRSRMPMHQGPGYVLGQTGGVETVTLTTAQLPAHTHAYGTGTTGTQVSPLHAIPAAVPAGGKARYAPTAGTAMNAAMVSSAGGSQPHENLSPFLAVTFCISLFGIFPS